MPLTPEIPQPNSNAPSRVSKIFDEIQARYRSDPEDQTGRFGVSDLDAKPVPDLEGARLQYYENKFESNMNEALTSAVHQAAKNHDLKK